MHLSLSGHLPSAALLALSAAIALAADRLATSPVGATGARTDAGGDVAPFMTPVSPDAAAARVEVRVPVDPFSRSGPSTDHSGVASGARSGSVSSTPSAGQRLTAILIADERRIAVIDDATVKVGDVLRDGARVAVIDPDRVWLADRNGRMRLLTLSTRGQ